MENTALQSTFELINNIDFEEKVNIEDLALPSDSTSISNMETLEIKEEPLEQSRSMISIHERNTSEELIMVHGRMNSSSFATNEVFQPEIILRHTPQSGLLPSKQADTRNEVFQSEVEKEIVKLFGEFDMMTLYDYNRTRVRKVKQLVEKYQTITQEVIVKLHENTLAVKTNELDRAKEELQLAKFKKWTLSKRIEELEMKKNQGSSQKKSLKPDSILNSGSKSEPEKKQLTAKSIPEEKIINHETTEVVDETLEESDLFVCLFSTDTLKGENVPYVPLPLRRRGIIQLRKRTKA